MNTSGAVLRKIACTAASALCLMLAMLSVPQQVLADDTDVFFPPDSVSAERQIRPNILFVLDTSGSMVGSGSLDGTSQTRLKRMQDAFSAILSGLSSEVNVGLMKFSGAQGGPVLFPVAHIDAYVDDIDTTSDGKRSILIPISDANSEATQTGAGTTSVAPTPLTLSGGNTASNMKRLALRFNNVSIPRGVSLSRANIQFNHRASGSTTGDLSAMIRIENVGDSQPLTSNTDNIGTTTRPVTGGIAWNNVGSKSGNSGALVTVDGDDYTTPDIAGLINAVISRSDWCGGNSLTIIIEGTNNLTTSVRNMIDSTTDSTLAPSLNLEYDATANATALNSGCINQKLASQISANSDDAFQNSTNVLTGCGPIYLNSTPSSSPSCGTRRLSTTSGLRFQSLNIKRGATIVSATLQVVAQGASSATPTLTIKAEKNDNPATYTSSSNNITNRSNFTATVSRSTTAWTDGQVVNFDVKTVVQEIVNQSNWDPKDPVSVIITGSSTSSSTSNVSKPIYSRETSAGKAAKLLVTVQGPADRMKVRDYLQELVYQFQGAGGTPTMGALYEAARYYRGEDAFYGLTRSGGENITQTEVNNINSGVTGGIVKNLRLSGRATFDYAVSSTTPSDKPAGCTDLNLGSQACELEKWTGTRKYKSPITDGCQSNNIILLSDGEPNNGGMRSGSDGPINKSAEELIGSMIGSTSCVGTASNSSSGTTRTNCGPELARFLSTQDQIPNSTMTGTQTVKLHAVAFGADVGPSSVGGAFLRSISVGTPEGTGGGGQFYAATSTAEVAAAFDAIISQILDVGTTFVAPAVTVNTFNRLTNRNELYFALFQPSTTASWPGNLKRYQVRQVTANGAPQIYDKNGSPAIDASTGFFADSACSYWTSTCNDGADVSKGGAASQLTTSRKIYTNLTGNSNVDLTTSTNAVTESNTGLTKAILGIPTASDDERTTLLQWARGIDVNDANGNGSTTDARTQLGDPLHSKPTVVSYGGTDANPDLAVFYGDNHGYLHALNASASSGQEYFSFIPKELLTNLNAYYDGSGLYSSRPYGVDGPIVPYIDTANSKKYVYVGLRRGGRSYYALDVTDRNAPKLAFTIAGGTTSSQGDFRELGQSWATPVLSKIRYNNTNYGAVLIFTGGYDPGQDSKTDLFSSGTTRSGDSQGRAIYVVDATTGQLLWWAGSNATATPSLTVADMVYSIPATPTPIDTDGDGFVDRIYFADAGGQVFRLVLNKDATGKPSLSNARADVVAKLSAAGVTNSRRFFNTPDVSLVTDGVVKPFLAVSIGTGHRERPLDTDTADRFYILKDPDVTNDTNSSTLPIAGESELYDATSNLAGSSDATVAQTAREAIYNAKGLYLRLSATEKVLSESSTFNNQVIFASYTPPSNTVASDACKAKSGDSRFYQINITDATPAQDFNNSGTLTTEDRYKQLTVAGLPPDPIILFPDIRTVTNDDGSKTVCNGSDCTANTGKRADPLVCVGAVCFNLNSATQVKKSYWRKVE